MPPTLRLHFVDRSKWVGVSAGFKLVVCWFVNVCSINLVVRDVGDPVLFELLGFSFVDVVRIHVVPSFKLLLLSVGGWVRALDVFDVQLVVVVHVFSDDLLVLDLGLDELTQRVSSVPVSGLGHLLHGRPLEHIVSVLSWIVMLLLVLLES